MTRDRKSRSGTEEEAQVQHLADYLQDTSALEADSLRIVERIRCASRAMSESQALLQHDDSPTALLAKKLRTLMQYDALQQGYLPATSQIQEHLAATIQSPVLNVNQRGLSRQTKKVLEDARQFVRAAGTLIRDKNQDDIIQEIVWNLRGASLSTDIDGDVFAARLDTATAKADAKTAHVKAKAIADVLYSNPQFRALLHDGSILARDVLSDVVEATATAIAPEESDLIELEEEATDVDGRTIKDDVDDTKRQFRQGIDSAKSQVKQTYDEATSSAMQTLQELQQQGQKFGADAQSKIQEVGGDAKKAAQQLAQAGQQKAKQMSNATTDAANQAIAKLEEVTGISKEDIQKQLNEGVSVQDIIEKSKDLAKSGSKRLQTGLENADQQAGRALTSVKEQARDYAKKNNLQAKTESAVQQAEDTKNDLTNKAKQKAADAQKKGRELSGRAGDEYDQALDQASDAVSGAKGQAKATTDDLKSKSEDVAEAGKNNLASAKSQTGINDSSSTGSHLQSIGIVHTNDPEENKSIPNADPKFMFDESSEARVADSSSSIDARSSNENQVPADLVQQVIKQIADKVQGIKGISQKDLEAAAKDLIAKTSDIAETVKDKAQDADRVAGQYASQVRDQGSEAAQDLKGKTEGTAASAKQTANKVSDDLADKSEAAKQKGSELANDAQKKGTDLAENAKQSGSRLAEDVKNTASNTSTQVKKSAQDLRERLANIDAQDLQNVVNNLLKNTKRKLEDTTGVQSEDVQQSLDWAIKRGEEMVEQIMRNGKQSLEVAQDKSAEAATTIKETSVKAGRAIEDTAVTVGAQTKHALQNAPRDAAGQIHETLDASQELMDNAVAVIKDSTVDIRKYLTEKFPPKRRTALRKHFQGLAVSLRDNSDYSNGLDGLISIARKYIDYTLTITDELPSEASDVVSTNGELDKAVRLSLQLIERFSNGVGFSGIQDAYGKLKKDMRKEKGSEDFLHDCMTYFKRVVQDLKYAASEDAEKHAQELIQRVEGFAVDSGFKRDVTQLIRETVRLIEGFTSDKVLLNFYEKGQTLFKHLVMNEYGNFVFKKRVMKDFFNIIMPSTLKLVQYIPISRIEFQNADVDVLIENLVFESSSNHDQSFLPYRLKIDNHNSVEFLNAYKFESDYSNKVTVKIEGLTMAVRDAGFYIRKKTGFWRFVDSGLLDLIMDGKGIDLDIDLQMSTDEEEADVTKDALFIVKDVRVNIHKFDFSTSGTKHGWLVGLIKPFIRGFVKRQIGLAVGQAMKEQLEYYEYQLRMLQHRIKTAYIANNGQASFESFFRAIFTANAGNNAGRKGQFEVLVGKPGPLAGIFTKASLQRDLENADAVAEEHGRPHSWRNDIFDLGI